MKIAACLALASSIVVASAQSCGSCQGCLWTYSGGTQCFTNAVKEACDAWGTGYTWCTGGSSTTAPPTTTPSPTSTQTPKPTTSGPTTKPTTPLPTTGTVLSPYIDLAMGTGSSLVSRMNSAGFSVVTLAFATGECGSENWGGSAPSTVVSTINSLVAAKKKYIISTGGAAGAFTCGSDANFLKFIKTYASDYLVGIDFDIEGGQSQNDINNLVQRVKNIQSAYPQLRYSFTVATLGPSAGGNSLNTYGTWVVDSIKSNGLSNYLINLMAMDYGAPGQWICVVTNGICDMGLSANQAAKNLKDVQGIPYNKIELTVMIGGNDVASNVFKISDVPVVSNFAKSNGLAGVHFWSLDRDVDCAPGAASPTCNSYGQAGTLGFSKAFVANL